MILESRERTHESASFEQCEPSSDILDREVQGGCKCLLGHGSHYNNSVGDSRLVLCDFGVLWLLLLLPCEVRFFSHLPTPLVSLHHCTSGCVDVA